MFRGISPYFKMAGPVARSGPGQERRFENSVGFFRSSTISRQLLRHTGLSHPGRKAMSRVMELARSPQIFQRTGAGLSLRTGAELVAEPGEGGRVGGDVRSGDSGQR
jgi:hypothetical protein